jgi:hypothetical protein
MHSFDNHASHACWWGWSLHVARFPGAERTAILVRFFSVGLPAVCLDGDRRFGVRQCDGVDRLELSSSGEQSVEQRCIATLQPVEAVLTPGLLPNSLTVELLFS